MIPGFSIPGLPSVIEPEPTDDPPEDPTDDTTDPPPFPDMEIGLSPRSGPPGTEVRVSGVGFDCSPGDSRGSVRVSWGSGDRDRAHDYPDETDGSFAVTITVPETAAGSLEINARCSRSDGSGRTASFTVEPAPIPSTSSPSPPTDPTTPTSSRPPPPAAPTPSARQTSPRVVTVEATPTSPGPTASPSPSPPAVVVPGPSATRSPGAPAVKPAGVPPISGGWSMPTLDRLSLSGPVFALIAAFAALLVILVAFPADVFNKTYETNRAEIHRTYRNVGLRGGFTIPGRWQASLLVLTAAALTMWLSSDEGPATAALGTWTRESGNATAQAVALLIAIPLVMVAYTGPGEIYLRWVRGKASLRVPMIALVVALACATVSHFLELKPTYTYGLFAMFLMVGLENGKEPTEGQRARGVLLGVGGLGVLLAAAYAGFSANWAPAHAAGAGWFRVLADATGYWTVVLGAETLIFALIPLRFLDGRVLAGWRLTVWTVLQFAAVCFFLMVVQGRAVANADHPDHSQILRALSFFLLFGVASLLFWGYSGGRTGPPTILATRAPRRRPACRGRPPRSGATATRRCRHGTRSPWPCSCGGSRSPAAGGSAELPREHDVAPAEPAGATRYCGYFSRAGPSRCPRRPYGCPRAPRSRRPPRARPACRASP